MSTRLLLRENFLSTYLQTGFVSRRRIYLKQIHFKKSASKRDDDVRKSEKCLEIPKCKYSLSFTTIFFIHDQTFLRMSLTVI